MTRRASRLSLRLPSSARNSEPPSRCLTLPFRFRVGPVRTSPLRRIPSALQRRQGPRPDDRILANPIASVERGGRSDPSRISHKPFQDWSASIGRGTHHVQSCCHGSTLGNWANGPRMRPFWEGSLPSLTAQQFSAALCDVLRRNRSCAGARLGLESDERFVACSEIPSTTRVCARPEALARLARPGCWGGLGVVVQVRRLALAARAR